MDTSESIAHKIGLPEDIEHMIEIYANDFAREGNPRDFNYADCVKLLEDCL